MSVNIYDVAYDVEKAIRASEQFKVLEETYKELESDPEAKQLFANFRDMQLKMQEKQMQGEEIPEDDIIQASIMIADVQKNEKIAKLLEAEERMGMIMTEINQIMIRPLEELYGEQ